MSGENATRRSSVTVASLAQAETLVGKGGGVCSAPTRLTPPNAPRLHFWMCSAGDVSKTLVDRYPHESDATPVSGAKCGVVSDDARWISIVEAAERYCALVYDRSKLVRATAAELGSDAIDLERLPRLSDAERHGGDGSWAVPSQSTRLWWVPCVEITSGRATCVPIDFIFNLVNHDNPCERLCPPISTGCAAHFDPREAVIAGILEAVERDALSLAWLQMLPLPRLDPASFGADAGAVIGANRRAHVATHLFDATTDLGVPVVYALDLAPFAEECAQVLGCAASFSPSHAADHALLETVHMRTAIYWELARQEIAAATGEPAPAPNRILVSAMRLGKAEMRDAFSFLLANLEQRRIAAPMALEDGDSSSRLKTLLAKFREKGFPVFATDLTTTDVRRAGLTVVKVFIPDLQPFSLTPQIQFRGHQRLYDAPRGMGYNVKAEGELNPHPNPFG